LVPSPLSTTVQDVPFAPSFPAWPSLTVAVVPSPHVMILVPSAHRKNKRGSAPTSERRGSRILARINHRRAQLPLPRGNGCCPGGSRIGCGAQQFKSSRSRRARTRVVLGPGEWLEARCRDRGTPESRRSLSFARCIWGIPRRQRQRRGVAIRLKAPSATSVGQRRDRQTLIRGLRRLRGTVDRQPRRSPSERRSSCYAEIPKLVSVKLSNTR